MRLFLKILLLFFCLFSPQIRAEVPSIVAHNYIGQGNHLGEITKQNAIASMFIVRPTSITSDPLSLESAVWESNRGEAFRLRKTFRRGVEVQYRNYGVLTGELPTSVKEDLDTLLIGNSSLIAICEVDNPEKILQIVSVAYDGPGGLTHEKRFREEFAGHKRPRPEWKIADRRFIEAYGSFHEIEMNSLILSLTPHFSGEPVEMKTLIKGHGSEEDWVPLIMRSLLANDLFRYGSTPLSDLEKLNIESFRGEIEKKLKEFKAKHWDPYLDKRDVESYYEGTKYRIFTQPRQRTVGIDTVRGICTGPRLLQLYMEEYGFRDTGIVFKKGEDPKTWVHIIEANRSDLENHIVDKFNKRKGLRYVMGENYYPHPNKHVTYQPCQAGLSQIGSALSPSLGTRGTAIGSMILY